MIRDALRFLAAMVAVVLPHRHWRRLPGSLPMEGAALAAGLATFFAGAAVGIPGFLEHATANTSLAIESQITEAMRNPSAGYSQGLSQGFAGLSIFTFLLLTPKGWLTSYLIGTGGVRMGAAWFGDPVGDPVLTGLDQMLWTLRARGRARQEVRARQALEGPEIPDRVVSGATAGIPGCDLVIVASRAKPGWSRGVVVYTADTCYRIGDPVERTIAGHLRTLYPLTEHSDLEAVRRLIAGMLVGPVDFDADVMPIFTNAGCNAAACHGAAAGRGGLALSLYGARPEGDYNAIVRERQGRRVNFREPATSLLLAKPTGQIEHGGDVRLDDAGRHATTIATWIREGARRGTSPALVRLEVRPAANWFESVPAETQLSCVAIYADGQRRQVRDLALYTAVDESALKINDSGSVSLLRRGRHVITVRYATEVAAITLTAPLNDERIDLTQSPGANFIDHEILAALDELRLPVSPAADDATLLRRLRLDLTGRLPTPHEVEQFLADDAADKHQQLVDRLLASDDFTDYWAYRFATWLRIGAPNSDPLAAQAFYDWVRQGIAAAVPLNEMASAMVTANGDTHAVGPANFYRAASDARGQAEYFSEVLLGVRLRCANCHNHPLDRWTQDDYHGLAAMFAKLQRNQTIRYLGRGEVSHPARGEAAVPRIPGEKFLPADGDHRAALAAWLTAKEHPYFARALVNRLWSALMGRGLVEPVDDFRATNLPTHPELLNRLAADSIAHDYDLRHTLRTIATSATYARSSQPLPANKADDRYYSHALKKPLSAEVRLDAICDVTGVPASEDPQWTRAIHHLGVAQVAPAALEELGRCSRAASCEANGAATSGLARQLALVNGDVINGQLRAKRSRVLQLVDRPTDEIVAQGYVLTLSRPPNSNEADFWRKALEAADAAERRARVEDFVWSLLNCDEFVNNH